MCGDCEGVCLVTFRLIAIMCEITPYDPTLKLLHGDLWSVVGQKRNHQTLKEKTVVTIYIIDR